VARFLTAWSECCAGGGVGAEDKDVEDADFALLSTRSWLLLGAAWTCFGVLCLCSKADRSNLEGFFRAFFGWDGSLNSPSMSSNAWAFEGRPLAIAEFEVCCDIDSGSLALS
jgi:hypothetical protein